MSDWIDDLARLRERNEPAIVVTVKFEGVVRHASTGDYSRRDPKIALIRSYKSAFEADDTVAIQKVYLDMSLS